VRARRPGAGWRRAVVLAALLTLVAGTAGGCESVNRATYQINQGFEKGVLTPLETVYEFWIPQWVRLRIRLFLQNFRYGDTVLNQFLQGKPELALQDLQRWLINSTVGLAGFFDPATRLGYPRHVEDFGQTLAVWGLPEGPYLVVPLIGPMTLRDGVGYAIAIWTSFGPLIDNAAAEYTLTAMAYLEPRIETLDDLRKLEEEAADAYVFLREAYLQRRRKEIHDGFPPAGRIEGLDDALELDELDELDGAAPGKAPDALEREPAGADDLPGLEDLGREPADADELPGLGDLATAPPTADDLPGLDDLGGPPGVADLSGLDDLPALPGESPGPGRAAGSLPPPKVVVLREGRWPPAPEGGSGASAVGGP
jgi:phospholipid-binding lipoprotein MlaA